MAVWIPYYDDEAAEAATVTPRQSRGIPDIDRNSFGPIRKIEISGGWTITNPYLPKVPPKLVTLMDAVSLSNFE
jgi:hypothetical protein